MATKIIKYRPQNGDVYHFETEVAAIVDFPDVRKYLTTDTAQNVNAKKIFTGYAYMDGIAHSTDTAPQFYGLRIKGITNFGAQINFGDGNYIYFHEYEEDRLRLHTKKFDLDSLSEGLSINGKVGKEGQVLTSHGAKAPTWENPSASGGGNFVTLDTEQEISGVKHFGDGVIHVGGAGEQRGLWLYDGLIRWDDGNASEEYSFPQESGIIALKSDIKTYTASTGISISSSNAISTTAASSIASGHVNTATQTFAGRKTFNGGINIPSGATIQLNGSSGTAGYVLTSNGTSSAPSWTNFFGSATQLYSLSTISTGSKSVSNMSGYRLIVFRCTSTDNDEATVFTIPYSVLTSFGTLKIKMNGADGGANRYVIFYRSSDTAIYISGFEMMKNFVVYGVK